MLCLGSIEMYCVKREICYKGTKVKKIFYNDHYSFVKIHVKKIGQSQYDRVISKFKKRLEVTA